MNLVKCLRQDEVGAGSSLATDIRSNEEHAACRQIVWSIFLTDRVDLVTSESVLNCSGYVAD